FRSEYPKVVGEDVEITCYAFQARLAQGDAAVHPEARALFLAGREAPASCEPVFTALAAAKQVDEADTWERIRRLLAANAVRDAKRANALLRPTQSFNDKTLDRAGADPAKSLAHEKAPILNGASKELVLYSVSRLARTKPDEAAERLALVAGRLGPEDARY